MVFWNYKQRGIFLECSNFEVKKPFKMKVGCLSIGTDTIPELILDHYCRLKSEDVFDLSHIIEN